ncbi:prenyl ase Rce1 protein [Rutstroemia sp. NJR-2017a WRK4]|nr:prenyl ase Rce1 protein [Rutstroemia sp. NJR-2017a WRK4]
MAPTGLYSRLKAYYTGEKEEEVPVLSTTTAVSLLVLYTLIYVIPFYLSSATRPSPQLSRDAPSVIRGRIRSVTISCIIVCMSTFILLSSVRNGDPIKTLHTMGIFPVGLVETVKCVALTAILFVGPLFEAGFAEGQWRDWIRLRGLGALKGWIPYRNIVAGPVTEEVLFRAASVPLLLLAKTSNTTIIFLTPVIFGLAHVHHFYEYRITHPHGPMLGAILRSLVQFSYTTLFGGYATFLYLRTGSLLAVILVHAFCNWMGLPRFWGRVTRGDSAETVIGPDVGPNKRSEDAKSQVANGELGIAWSVAYYALLFVGAYSWWKYLWTLSASELALVKF